MWCLYVQPSEIKWQVQQWEEIFQPATADQWSCTPTAAHAKAPTLQKPAMQDMWITFSCMSPGPPVTFDSTSVHCVQVFAFQYLQKKWRNKKKKPAESQRPRHTNAHSLDCALRRKTYVCLCPRALGACNSLQIVLHGLLPTEPEHLASPLCAILSQQMKFPQLQSVVKTWARCTFYQGTLPDSSQGIFSLIEITYITVIPSVSQECFCFVCVCENSLEPKVAGAKRIIALMLCHRSGRLQSERRVSYITRLGRLIDF